MNQTPDFAAANDRPFSASALERAERILRKAKVPGAVLARVSSRGIEAMMAFGFSDVAERRATTVDTAFHLYSATKLFTASALMLLAERGQIDIDTDIRPHFAEFSLDHSVTPRQLLSHASGLKDTLRAFIAIHTPEEPRPTTAEALRRYELSGGKAPGEKANYRNVNYAVLGELIARVAGVSYEQFVHTELLQPWGSAASFTCADAKRFATGYVPRFDPMRLAARFLLGRHSHVFDGRVGGHVGLRRFDLDTAAIGGLVGAVADFTPLVAEFLGDEDGVLRAETRRTMFTLVSKGAAGIASRVGVGLGFKLGLAGQIPFVNHEGGGPGFCTELRIYPTLGIGFVVLTNLSQSRRLSWTTHDLCELLRSSDALGGAAV